MSTIYEDVAELQSKVAQLELQLVPTILAQGTDLNNLAVGEYIIPSEEISRTLLNKPTTSTATAYIKVVKGGNDGQLIMFYYICNKTITTYYQRAYYGTGWGDWNIVNPSNDL